MDALDAIADAYFRNLKREKELIAAIQPNKGYEAKFGQLRELNHLRRCREKLLQMAGEYRAKLSQGDYIERRMSMKIVPGGKSDETTT